MASVEKRRILSSKFHHYSVYWKRDKHIFLRAFLEETEQLGKALVMGTVTF